MTEKKRTRRKVGRPLVAGEPRTEVFRIRCVPEQYEAWQRAAHADGLDVSAWARRILDGLASPKKGRKS